MGGRDEPALAERLRVFQEAVASLSVADAFPAGLWRRRANESGPAELPSVAPQQIGALRRNALAVALEGRDEDEDEGGGSWLRFAFNAGNEELDPWLLTELYLESAADAAAVHEIWRRLAGKKRATKLPPQLTASEQVRAAVALLIERGVLIAE